jgi:hypothetical protein
MKVCWDVLEGKYEEAYLEQRKRVGCGEDTILSCTDYKEPDIVKAIKICRLRWIGHVMRMDVDDPVRKTLLEKPGEQCRRGRPRTKFLDNVEEDLGNVGIRAWRRTAMGRDAWKNDLKEAEANLGL